MCEFSTKFHEFHFQRFLWNRPAVSGQRQRAPRLTSPASAPTSQFVLKSRGFSLCLPRGLQPSPQLDSKERPCCAHYLRPGEINIQTTEWWHTPSFPVTSRCLVPTNRPLCPLSQHGKRFIVVTQQRKKKFLYSWTVYFFFLNADQNFLLNYSRKVVMAPSCMGQCA